MTRDDIIKMAREAWDRDTDSWLTYEQAFLARFAALVAAAEREACAQVCNYIANKPSNVVLGVAMDCATAIRARSNT